MSPQIFVPTSASPPLLHSGYNFLKVSQVSYFEYCGTKYLNVSLHHSGNSGDKKSEAFLLTQAGRADLFPPAQMNSSVKAVPLGLVQNPASVLCAAAAAAIQPTRVLPAAARNTTAPVGRSGE